MYPKTSAIIFVKYHIMVFPQLCSPVEETTKMSIFKVEKACLYFFQDSHCNKQLGNVNLQTRIFFVYLIELSNKIKVFFQCARRCAVTELSSEHKITIAIFHRHFLELQWIFALLSTVLTASCFFARFTIFFSIPFFFLVVFHKKFLRRKL